MKHTQEVDESTHVSFSNIKDGNPFFYCSPQEARVAIREIKNSRKHHEFLKITPSILKFAQETDDFMEETLTVSIISEQDLFNLFKSIEKFQVRVSHIFMHAIEYADLRIMNKGILDVETRPEALNTGILAYAWGAQCCVKKDLKGQMIFVGADDPNNIKVLKVKIVRDKSLPISIPSTTKDLDIKLDKIMAHLNID